MGLFDSPEVQPKASRSYVGVIVLVSLALVGAGAAAHHLHARHVAQAKVAADQQDDRVQLRVVAKVLVGMGTQIDQIHKDMTDILVKETKYKKVAGEQIAQPLPKDAQRRYDTLNDLLAKSILEYNTIAGTYNQHRAAYKGPWPDGPVAPALFPLL